MDVAVLYLPRGCTHHIPFHDFTATEYHRWSQNTGEAKHIKIYRRCGQHQDVIQHQWRIARKMEKIPKHRLHLDSTSHCISITLFQRETSSQEITGNYRKLSAPFLNVAVHNNACRCVYHPLSCFGWKKDDRTARNDKRNANKNQAVKIKVLRMSNWHTF